MKPLMHILEHFKKKPTYTRARANLGISYSAIRNFPEAAKCFLGALEINNTQHLWDNLKKAFMDMNRPDLVSKIDIHKSMAETGGNAGNVKVFVKYIQGRGALLYCHGHDTIATIKQKAAPVLGLSPAQRDLFLSGQDKPLQDKRTVDDYNILSGAQIKCVAKAT